MSTEGSVVDVTGAAETKKGVERRFRREAGRRDRSEP